MVRFAEALFGPARHLVHELAIGTPCGARLMATGPFTDDDLGVACYHSKTGAAELYLNHLADGPGEYVVVDCTAGAESFASGMFTRFDLTKDGTRLLPYPMDYASYSNLTAPDLDAMVAYLRTVPPVVNKVPKPKYKFLPAYLWGKFNMLILGGDPPIVVYPGNAGTRGAR